jgi:alpha-tubulin suppressor-like RCC1 family protein
MNVANLELILTQKVNNSTSTLDALIYSKALQELKTGTITVVNTTAELPNPNTSLIGHLFFEKTTEAMYIVDQLGFARRILGETGNMVAVGEGNSGQLGNGASSTRLCSPVTPAGGGTTWCAVTASITSSAGIKTDGTLWTWGANSNGKLGTTNARCSPGTVLGAITGWCAVSMKDEHTAALTTGGILYIWGSNSVGQFGNGYSGNTCSCPVFIGSGWSRVSVGNLHTLGISSTFLYGWGGNGYGQVGNGTTTNASTPTNIGGGAGWCAVSAGDCHSAAIKTDGTLWTWGNNGYGRLGDGTTTHRSTPVTTAGGGTNWCAVSAGTTMTAAIKTDGTLWTWGSGGYGQLGTGNSSDRSSPVTVVGGGRNWCLVCAGQGAVGAIKTDGTLWTWGDNSYSQLLDGTTTGRSIPGSVVAGLNIWTGIVIRRFTATAIKVSNGD